MSTYFLDVDYHSFLSFFFTIKNYDNGSVDICVPAELVFEVREFAVIFFLFMYRYRIE